MTQIPEAAVEAENFQTRVDAWLLACFGETIARDKRERDHRLLEEALETVQSGQCTRSEAHQLVDYVFDRPVGEPRQEVGGVMNTLAAWCIAYDIDLNDAAETELARVWTKVEKIRAKQAAKPKHSPLPEAAAPLIATLSGSKRPAAFRVRKTRTADAFDLTDDEATAQSWAESRGVDYEGLYRVGDRRAAMAAIDDRVFHAAAPLIALASGARPTQEMIEAGYDATRLAGGTPQFAGAGFCLGHADRIFRAMIAAAPLPPVAPADGAVEAAVLADVAAALEPFAWIGQWFFARDLPDSTPVMTVTGFGKPLALTRGMFKAAHTALDRARSASPKPGSGV